MKKLLCRFVSNPTTRHYNIDTRQWYEVLSRDNHGTIHEGYIVNIDGLKTRFGKRHILETQVKTYPV